MARRNRAATTEPKQEEGTTEMTDVTDQPEEVREETIEEQIERRAQELAEQKLAEMKKTTKKKDKPERRKPELPEGWISPVAFHHVLVERGLASENMSPVQVYGLVRKADSNGMPVRHFNKAGEQFDTIQTHPVTNETLTRPGLQLDEALEWWQNRPKRQAGQKKDKTETNGASDETSSEDLEDAAALEADSEEDFVEAE